MENPFKFGTIVEENYFTDRVEEVAYIEQFMKSAHKGSVPLCLQNLFLSTCRAVA